MTQKNNVGEGSNAIRKGWPERRPNEELESNRLFCLSLLLTTSLGAGGQNFRDGSASRGRVRNLARQLETATANFAQVLRRRVRGFFPCRPTRQ